MIHTVKDLSVVNETEVYAFLEFPCFLYDPMDAGNLGNSVVARGLENVSFYYNPKEG